MHDFDFTQHRTWEICYENSHGAKIPRGITQPFLYKLLSKLSSLPKFLNNFQVSTFSNLKRFKKRMYFLSKCLCQWPQRPSIRVIWKHVFCDPVRSGGVICLKLFFSRLQPFETSIWRSNFLHWNLSFWNSSPGHGWVTLVWALPTV